MLAALLLAAAQPAAAAPAPAASCRMAPADRAWIEGALAHWRRVQPLLLKLKPAPLPAIVTFDARCRWVGRERGSHLVWQAAPHGGKVTLPDGNTLPVGGPVSFAGPAGAGEAGGFFVMSLPSLWRAGGVTSELGLERLMDGVLLHELMHTRQFYFATPTLDALTKRYGLPADISDDSLQDRFKSDQAYVAAYEAERDTLFRAAAAPTDAEAHRLAGEALALLRGRRARFFTGVEAKWAPLDDLFLLMEGLGQWLAYAWYVSPQGAHLPAAQVLPAVRRKRNYWNQDEGLALMLTVDRLVPGWQRHAFAPQPELAEALLARAASGRSGAAR